jgi:probable HAF family extracellular repeat protein
MSLMRLICFLAVLGAILGAAVARAGGPTYTAVDLGSFGGRGGATALSNSGLVVGSSQTSAGLDHAFLWRNETMSDLGLLNGLDASVATDVNSGGQVVGFAHDSLWSNVHGFLWKNGVMTDLGTLGGTYTVAVGINGPGQVIGTSMTSDQQEHAFIWQHGVMTDLGTLGGGYAVPHAINQRGQVVGESTTAAGEDHAFIWQNGVKTDLGETGFYSYANDVNERGQITGSFWAAPGDVAHCVIWTGAQQRDLGTLGGDCVPEDINERGQVVGFSNLGGYHSPQHAFVWRGSTMVDLGARLDVNTYAIRINERGQIAGSQNPQQAVAWQQDNTMVDLGPGNAGLINDRGEIAGGNGDHPVLWKASP